jgi:hypothetical protein
MLIAGFYVGIFNMFDRDMIGAKMNISRLANSSDEFSHVAEKKLAIGILQQGIERYARMRVMPLSTWRQHPLNAGTKPADHGQESLKWETCSAFTVPAEDVKEYVIRHMPSS